MRSISPRIDYPVKSYLFSQSLRHNVSYQGSKVLQLIGLTLRFVRKPFHLMTWTVH